MKIKPSFIPALMLLLLIHCSENIVSECQVCTEPAGETITFSEIQQDIFNVACVSCHGGASPTAGLDLSQGNAYENLVNVNASTANASRVVPFSSEQSYLVDVLIGEKAPLMPPGTQLSQAKIDSVIAWIDRGAKND